MMEFEKRYRSASKDKKNIEKPKTGSKYLDVAEKRKKDETNIGESLRKDKMSKVSLIPVLKGEKIDLRFIPKKVKQSSEPSKPPCSCPCTKKTKQDADLELKLRILEEKEKSIAEYYRKIEETLRKIVVHKEQKNTNESVKEKEVPQNNVARKMTSEPTVHNKACAESNVLTDFENNVEQISSIWLQTSSDLYKTLKYLKKNPIVDPMEFEMENVKIKMAIKQAKSLTLVKTKSVIAEAKKLYRHGELIRTELEKLMSNEDLKQKTGKCTFTEGESLNNSDEMDLSVSPDESEKKEANGTGDSSKESDLEDVKRVNSKEKTRKDENSCLKEKTISENSPEKQTKVIHFSSPKTIEGEMEILASELAKKNETITGLNNKIFELQKSCNEHIHRYNDLQGKLSEFQEKIQWNQVLWKQIGKLKERILGLQQSNKQLESHKRELENKITKLDKELERLIKLNHLLNQRKYLLSAHECNGKNCTARENEFKNVDEKNFENDEFNDDTEGMVLSNKQNAIKQLKTVLGAMKDQENFAQKQIAMFQSKIEALEKKT